MRYPRYSMKHRAASNAGYPDPLRAAVLYLQINPNTGECQTLRKLLRALPESIRKVLEEHLPIALVNFSMDMLVSVLVVPGGVIDGEFITVRFVPWKYKDVLKK